MKKRIIGVLLCVAMVCTLLPLNAFAADGNILHYDYNDGTFEGKTFVDENPDTASGKYHYIIDTVPVREGYVFNGWNTEKDGSGDSYSYGDIYYFEDIGACYDTVYAQWKLHNWIDYADTSWYDSDPEATSYTISTAEQLAGVAKLTSTEYLAFSGQTITLASDISLDGKEWTPIGGFNTFANRGFYGTFDGAGYTISGLFIDASTECQGLFGEAIKATVKNLKVSGSVSGNIFVAGIVASACDTVIENCVNDCVLFGKEYVGGIAGTNRSSLITDCCNIAEINANPSYNNPSRVGGIVGYNAGFVSNCYNIGDVSGTNMVGGVVGNTYFTSKDEVLFTDPAILEKCVTGIYNCYNIGSVTGNRNVSGVCGFLSGSASKCYNLGILESTETVVAGVAFTSTLSSVSVADCYYLADCNASGNAFANKVGTALSSKNFRKQASFSGFDFNNTWEMGALAPVLKSFNNKGTSDNPYPIANLEMLEYMRDTVNSGNEALFNNGSVVLLRDIDLGCDENNQWEPIGTLNCFFFNDFDGRGHVITGLYINKPTENYIGFFASYGGGKTVKNLGVYGTVIGNEYVGGIAGMAYAYFENCFNACTVTGNSYVAGIAGYGSFSDYANCYNIGNITCKDNICGGISTDPYYTEVYYCYNFGTIDCKGDDVYPIVNLSKYGNEIKNCYYLDTCYADGTVFGTGDGVSALSEADFADKSKFVGWDFDNTWDLSDSTVKRPLLKNAAEKGTSLNPFKVAYTDDKDGVAIREFYYVTYNEPTPQCQINLTDMASWKFSEWDKPIAAKVTCDVTYTAKISMKDDNTVTFFGNGGTYSLDGNVYDSTIRYYKSAAITVDPECNFTRDGFRLLGWSTMSNGSGTTYQVGDNFEFNYPHNEERYSFYAVWQDTEKPVFVGLENNKTYCKSVKFKVTDNGSIASVKAGDTTLTADEEGYYTLTNTSGLSYQPITVTATDIGGNVETVTVKVNKEHVMSHWKNDGTHYWQCCGDCGVDSAEKYTLPEVQITGSDTVCRNEKYIFTVALPGGCGFGECFGASWNITPKLQADGTYLCVVEDANNLEGKESFEVRLQICVEEHPGFYYNLTKTVTVLEKLTPEITEGNAQKVTAGENTELTFRSNAAFADFIRVEVDGVTIDEKNYTVKEGSTIVTLTSDYMATLSAGEHTLSIVSAGGTATASFTVEAANVPSGGAPNSSATGDSSNVLLWIAVLFVSVIGLVSAGFFKKKKSC